MKKTQYFFRLLFLSIILISTATSSFSQTKKVLFQGFWWDYENGNYSGSWANYLAELAPRLRSMGVDAVWIPPSIKNQNFGQPGVGYAPFDNYDLGDKFQKGEARTRVGTKDELLRMIAVMHANGIEIVQDIVPNHIIGAGSDVGGNGGEDPASTNDAFSNFRYTCYATPATDQSANDYLSREGRFSKNYQNFHANAAHNCNSGDICQAFFGPDICYFSGAHGQSSNAIFNPVQPANYMRDQTREWLVWYRKQTGFDGVRIDAVKHFDAPAAEDFLFNLQNLGGGNSMFAVGEYVGGTSDVDGWYSAVQGRAGVFDFSLRAFDGNGGLHGMVYGFDNFDMSTLPAAQQTGGNRINNGVHKTVPFVNNHDTFRPQFDANGNYSGWNTGDELSAHIEPNEPRLAAAYAVIMAVDGNPQIFFEDLFDIGYNSNRFGHDPKNSSSLPAREDLINLMQCHQKLDFKGGTYKVRSAVGVAGQGDPFVVDGQLSDHLVIERSGKAIIGITDKFDLVNGTVPQNIFVDSDFSQGTILQDYSGANGTTTYTVPADGRVRIITQPVNFPQGSGQYHGYSVWAPVPGNVPFNSVADMQSYLATYTPSANTQTTQEWEMADDLGDSHCSSLMQGGALPANSTNQRVVGRIFTEIGQQINYELYPESGDVTVIFYDVAGNELHTATGGNGTSGAFATAYTGWVNIKIRNATIANAKQKCFVKVSYTAPQVVSTNSFSIDIGKSIWTGNGNDSDVGNCQNWEQGKMPTSTTEVLIPSYSSPAPNFTGIVQVKNIVIEAGASINVDGTLEVFGDFENNGTLGGCGTVSFKGSSLQNAIGNSQFCVLEVNNNDGVNLAGENSVTQELRFTDGKFFLNAGDLILETGATITGNSATKYVQTSANNLTDGFLVRDVNNTSGDVIFPIGNSNYNPVTIINSGINSQFSARVFDGVFANGTTGANIENGEEVGKSWEITAANAGVNANVTVEWNASEHGGAFNLNEAVMAKNSGSNWETLSSSAVAGSNPYSISAGNIATFSTFAVGSNGSNFTVLPVELTTFTGRLSGENALLNWSTASEINNEGFIIEKSIDGQTFTKIGFVKGAGDALVSNDYEFLDRQFLENSYYRLQQIDFDGQVAFSEVVFLKKEKKTIPFSVSPNPFSEKITLRAASNFNNDAIIHHRLMTIDGKIISEGNGTLATTEQQLNERLKNVGKGVYLLSLDGSNLLKLIKE